MASKRNRFLTPAMERMLKAMRDGKDEYAIQERLKVYVDLDQFSVRTLNKLLRLCLISVDSFSSEKTKTYELNDEGRKILEDPDYEPMIVEHYRTGKDVTR